MLTWHKLQEEKKKYEGKVIGILLSQWSSKIAMPYGIAGWGKYEHKNFNCA